MGIQNLSSVRVPAFRFLIPRVVFSCLLFLIFTTTPTMLASCVLTSEEGQQFGSNIDLPNPLKAEVIGIQDGDTIELKFIYSGKKAGRRMGKPVRIRFLHINCPERGMPFYKNAKQFTSEKCFRKVVSIRHKGEFDKYGRLLGEIVLPDGKILNKELVKKGLAVHFKKYSKDQEYAALEIAAEKQKVGIWSQPGMVLGHL
ncbi:thermonuclease family protein [Dyadobacter sp. CY261]|uniref:thermonuclease family protein n=1 Tax=Dyadobacter sp. CY261 TaxID=2907203 RepID=UPI001F2B5D73|nr:thermonuclease family protein [Dyadobacter sp. CY261]MCF0073713.1 thermonuclease family protein [Dyadobacter sp. CY261]